jgi:cation diffusion facilitator CzcD-associated flavoprotein CzcO
VRTSFESDECTVHLTGPVGCTLHRDRPNEVQAVVVTHVAVADSGRRPPSTTEELAAMGSGQVEELDVVIIGAGISGIGAATYVTRELPERSVAVLEGRDSIGGTWDLFRYPGIRSDSDLHTFGYAFKPWRHENAIADAHLIRDYLQETVEENGLTGLIRFRHKVVAAQWSTERARWTLTVEVSDAATGSTATRTICTRWVFAATGYYRYDEGYSPQFPGSEDFAGTIVHPQHWPEDLDYAGRKVVIIGSGATAVTMVPAMLTGDGAASHVTMLQRTPTYIMAMPRVDGLALALTKLLGEKRGYAATRAKNIWLERAVVLWLRRFPKAGRRYIRRENRKRLPEGFDVDKHFNPPYNPWDQRLCLAPDGDFFDAIKAGNASVVTDTIARITERGILLDSGEELEADVIVTATGLNMQLFSGMPIAVDGQEVDITESYAYRGMLLSGIPNWAMAIGYTTSSWTLKVSLMCRYFVDLQKHMDAHGHDYAVPVAEAGLDPRPVMDLQSGYARRAAGLLPRQGASAPWRMAMSYQEDAKALRGPVHDEHLHFGTRVAAADDEDKATEIGSVTTTRRLADV